MFQVSFLVFFFCFVFLFFPEDTVMNRNIRQGSRALAAFTVTVALAVAATAMTLVPDEAVQSVDSLTTATTQLDKLLSADLFN